MAKRGGWTELGIAVTLDPARVIAEIEKAYQAGGTLKATAKTLGISPRCLRYWRRRLGMPMQLAPEPLPHDPPDDLFTLDD